MEKVLITQEKNYLVLRIPIEAVSGEECLVSGNERVAIAKGMEDFEKGRHSKVFDNAKEAISFLRSL